MATNGDDDLLLVARSGQTLRISEKDVRPMGRSAAGVKGMKFRGNEAFIGRMFRRGIVKSLI